MFVRNTTRLDVRLTRGRLFDDLSIAATVVTYDFRAEAEELVPLTEPPGPREDDPPDVSRHPLWEGVSVTVAGSALGPSSPPYVAPVSLRVGGALRRLIIFGERRWERHWGGTLEASPPATFDRIALSFKRAFGGGYEVPPGLLAGTDLPHPGFRMAYVLNENGIGFYPDEGAATGGPLPNIEWPHQLMKKWNDTPEPAGFTPCPELIALRGQVSPETLDNLPRDPEGIMRAFMQPRPSLRVLHYAPPSLIFGDVPAGTPIELHGLASSFLRFVVPPPSAHVFVRRGRRDETVINPRLRGIHVDADARLVRLTYDHSFTYDARRPPTWIVVGAPERG
jgi:hypothetical protein